MIMGYHETKENPMKRLIVILIAVTCIFGLVVFVPHSPFAVIVETPTRLSTPEYTSVAALTKATPTAAYTVTPAGLAESTPTPYAGTPAGIQVTYQGVSFEIPAGLASNADGATMPASAGPLDPAPEFIQFTIKGYPFTDPNGYYHPRVRVYPVMEYVAISSWAAESLKRLQNVLDNPSGPMTNDVLPNVPYMGSAAQLYAAQVKQIAFKDGKGVRMISSYAQFPAPISQGSSFYHYEGLTQDGKYYVVVEMPVVLPVYADSSNPGEFGITYERKDWSQMDPYYLAVTDLLNQASPEGFNPMLGQLDALVASLEVKP
jgi:hypothetical protein